MAPFVDADDLTGRSAVALPKNVNDPAGTALRDALKLLGCKQMKISFGAEAKKQNKAAEEKAEVSGEVDDEEGQKEEYEASLLKRNLAFQVRTIDRVIISGSSDSHS